MPGETVVHGRTPWKQAGVCTRARKAGQAPLPVQVHVLRRAF